MEIDGFSQAVAALRAGEPVVFPTDTVYGLGISVEHASSPSALYALKQRTADKPIAWLVDGPDALDRYGADVSDQARELVRAQWPGALTVIVKAGPAVPSAFQSHAGTIGLRMPDDEVALALIGAVGCPLATTSANRSGGPDPRRFSDVDPQLIELVSASVHDDRVRSGTPSTVLDCSGDEVVVLRQGAFVFGKV